MNQAIAILGCACLSAIFIAPALAAEEKACVRNNRLWAWDAKDDHTLIITDRDYKKYTVSLRGGCIGLGRNYAGIAIALITRTRLGCLTVGDRVAFRSPALGRLTCFVSDVKAGVPPPKAATPPTE
jgi:hypothetical protein